MSGEPMRALIRSQRPSGPNGWERWWSVYCRTCKTSAMSRGGFVRHNSWRRALAAAQWHAKTFHPQPMIDPIPALATGGIVRTSGWLIGEPDPPELMLPPGKAWTDVAEIASGIESGTLTVTLGNEDGRFHPTREGDA